MCKPHFLMIKFLLEKRSLPNYIMHDYQQFKTLRSVKWSFRKEENILLVKENRKSKRVDYSNLWINTVQARVT